MDWEYIVWCVGLVATILTIVTGVHFLVQLFSKKRKRALLFENVECKLYQAKEHDRVALCVYYDGVKQQSNLVVLKAKLTNTGQEDLSKSVLADPIKLLCGEGYRIINAMVVGEYEKIRPSLMWSPDSVELSWDLLKRKGCFEIEIIATIDEGVRGADIAIDFYNAINIDINADGIDFVDKQVGLSRGDKSIKFRKRIMLFYLFLLLGCGVYLWFQERNTVRYSIAYELIVDSCKYISPIAYRPFDDSVKLVLDEQECCFSIDEFNSLCKVLNVADVELLKKDVCKYYRMNYGMIIFCVGCVCCIFILDFMRKKRRKR